MKDVDLEKEAYPSDSPKALRISRGGETPSAIAPFGIPLYSYTAVPGFLQGNPYITDGYRAHLSPKLCVKRCACVVVTLHDCIMYVHCMYVLGLLELYLYSMNCE